ncbi:MULTISPECIES: hypothetical protein [Planktothrix]|uniref:hypothetical protein n=1 Tax=Planktothrix TaxID=54304 RepID=UPI00117BFA5A|nr:MULTISPECIES: hypothetical protein [Planktothrix]
MISAKRLTCLYNLKFCQTHRITPHNHIVEYSSNYSTISQNLQNLHRKTVDSNKLRLPMFGDAIATLTTNTTKPTGPSCRLGGFVVSENLSTHQP